MTYYDDVELAMPSPALLARYPENLPYLLHHRPLEPYVAGKLALTPLYAREGGVATRLYFIQADAPRGPIKIGVAKRPQERLAQLQVASPDRLTLVAHVPGTVGIEHSIHDYLARHRRVSEWFHPAVPVLEVVAEFFEISLMLEDFVRDGAGEMELEDLAAIMTEREQWAA